MLDVNQLLLAPNALLFLISRNHFVADGKCFQVNIFPKLNIGSDPVIAVFSEKNVSDKVITCEDIFGRTYDRSGMFMEFQLSGRFNSRTPAKSLYWLHMMGIGGGLGGSKRELPENSRVYKGIIINDYIHFAKVGLYDIQFKYCGDAGPEYNLKKFFVLSLPENHIAKIVKSMFVRILLKFPNDDVRGFAIKCLSYQENFVSTYILARYYFAQHMGMEKVSRMYNNSTIKALTGIIRNQNVRVVSQVLRMFQKRNSDVFRKLNYFYLGAHIERYPSGFYFKECFDEQEAQSRITQLIDEMYPGLENKYKAQLRHSLLFSREVFSDEYLLFTIRWAEKSGREKWKQYKIEEYNRKEDREKIIRLIDFVYTRISEPPITAAMIQQVDSEESSVYIPKNLEECFVELEKILTEIKLTELKNMKEDKITWYNFSVDVWMRTNWKLWSGSRLTEYFNGMEVFSPRDMSRIILRSFHRRLHNRDIDLEQQVNSIKKRKKANE